MSRTVTARPRRLAPVMAALLVASLVPAIAPAVASAAATRLSIVSVTPASVAAGGTVQIVVAASDGSAIVTDFSGGVTVTSSDPLAVIDPTSFTYRPEPGGLKTFAVRLSTAGAQTVTFASAGLTSATAIVSVTAGAATKLVFITQPSSSSNGWVLPTQPRVAAQDANGNTITDNTANVTIELTGATAGSGVLGTCASTRSAGVTTFTGCRIVGAGRAFRLRAKAAGLSDGTSAPFDISSRLWYEQGPGTKVFSRTPFTTQKVSVQWAASGTMTTSTRSLSDNSTVLTLSIKPGTGASGAVLTCAQSANRATVTAGYAEFTGCSIDKAGTGYRLLATSNTGLTAAETGTFEVAVGSPTRLTFLQEPSTGTAGTAFGLQPIVGITDEGGNVVTNARATVLLTLSPSSIGTGSLSCSSATALATATSGANAGRALFSGCRISQPGFYVLTATAVSPVCGTTACSLLATNSKQIQISVQGAGVTLASSASTVVAGKPVTLTTSIAPNGGNRAFTIQRSRDGVTWNDWRSLTTGTTGSRTYTFTPTYNFSYRAYFAGTTDLTGGVSATTRVNVRQSVVIRPHSTLTQTVLLGRTKTYATTVKPAVYPGGRPIVRYYVWKRSGTSWKVLVRKDVTADSSGVARYTYKFTSRGTYRVRAVAFATAYNAQSPATTTEYVRVP